MTKKELRVDLENVIIRTIYKGSYWHKSNHGQVHLEYKRERSHRYNIANFKIDLTKHIKLEMDL
jgi:hypothetical protein